MAPLSRARRKVGSGPAIHSSAWYAPVRRLALHPVATQASAQSAMRGMHARTSAAFAAGASRANGRARSRKVASAASRRARSVGSALAIGGMGAASCCGREGAIGEAMAHSTAAASAPTCGTNRRCP